MEFLREALFPSDSKKSIPLKLNQSNFREIIQLCEGDQKARTRLLDLGGLSLGFWVIRKWIAVNVVSEWEQSVQGPSLDHEFCVFYGKIEKPCSSRSALVRHLLASFARTDVFWRCDSWRPVVAAGWKEVLRAPAAHGVSSNPLWPQK